MNILLAFDKFRGSLTSAEAIEGVKKGLLEIDPNINIRSFQLADGGEGSLEILSKAYDCELKEITTQDAIGKLTKAHVGFNPKGKVGIIEMAQHVGLAKLPNDQRNPSQTSSYGVGEAINKLAEWGAKRIIIGIGGSATNDGGAGMLEALGYQFLNKNGEAIRPCGGNLQEIEHIIKPTSTINDLTLKLASDVLNPLLGPTGATQMYGPQKGAREEDLPTLEKGMGHFASLVQKLMGRKFLDKQGYGAAGGFPLGACEVLGAEIQSGSQLIFEELQIEEAIRHSAVVVTGEGKIDGQTLFGKAIAPILESAKSYDKKAILVCGICESEDPDINQLERYELSKLALEMNLDSFANAYLLAFEVGRRIATRLYQ